MTKDFQWISKALRDSNFKASLSDASKDYSIFSVQGPYSRTLLQAVAASPVDLNPDSLAFSKATDIVIADCMLRCMRLTFVGELGYELHVPIASANRVFQEIFKAGEEMKEARGVPFGLAGYRAIDSLSAEKGYRHWHADLANSDTPQEANIFFTISSKLNNTTTKYIGREAHERQRATGLRRKLVCLTVDDTRVPLHGQETIWRDGECVGFVRSTAFGHTIGRSIAYGYIELKSGASITKSWLKQGRYEIGDKGTKHTATLHLKAPFDPSGERVKGNYRTNTSCDGEI